MKCPTRKEWLDPLENLSDMSVSSDFIDFERGSQTICGRGVPRDVPLA